MDLLVAGRMHEHAVLDRVFAPMGSPPDVMVMPPRQCGDLLVADRTDPVLLLPKETQRPSAHQVPRHLHAETFFEVRFPGRVIRIRFSSDLGMPFNRHTRGGVELDRVKDPFPPDDRSPEAPMSSTDAQEV